MKWLPSLSAALAVSVMVIATVVVGVNVLALAVVGAPFFALGVLVTDGAVRRDRAVRKLVVAAYAADRPDTLAPTVIARVLGSRDVVKARTDYLRREDARLSSAYQSGDASDY